MSQTPLQTIIDPSSDAALNVYATNNQSVPVIQSATVTITNTTQYVTEIYNMKATAAGNVGELGFNDGNGFAADSGLTYNANTDSLTVGGTVFAGNIRTDNLQYANGTTISLGGSSYGNGNVASYLPTYNGTITGATIVSSGNSNAATFNGSGAGLTNLPAANIVGTVANATYAVSANSATSATTAGTVTTSAQPNITSVGTLSGLTVTNTISGNISGSAATASTAGTVTTAAQSNITSLGSLSGLTVSNSTGTVNFTTTANVTLGAVSNLHIAGGTTGQVLTTNGSGNLTWSTASSSTPNLQQVTTANATTDQQVVINNTTAATGYNSGALIIDGGIGAAGNIFSGAEIAALTAVYAGQYAAYSSFTLPKFFGRDAGAEFIQGALQNTEEHGSADWVAYGDQSTDSLGWADFGFTGSAFNDPNYTITKANDGYFFVQGLSGLGGNLVIATGSEGGVTHRDIVFATGGFAIEDEKMRLNHEDSTLYVGGHAHDDANVAVVNIDINGNLTVAGTSTLNEVIVSGNITPNANVTYDLGNTTHRFKDLWLSGTTIHLGGTAISVDANTGGITMGNLSFNGNGTVSGNSITGSVANAAYADNSQNAQYAYAVNGANVTGQVANALVAGTVYTNAQPNITSVGTLNGLSAIGSVNLGSAANVTITGASANGQVLTSDTNGHLSWTTVSGSSSYGDSDVLTLLDTIVGNINISANAQLNVNGGASFDSAYVSGNITAGNVSGATLTGNLVGTVTTAAQPNITSVGTLSSLSVTGNISTSGTLTSTGKIGYSAGNTVTQTTSRSTAVTINALSGEITLFGSSMTGGQVDYFTMTNNQLVVGDMIVCTTYGGSLGTYLPMAYVSSNTQAMFTVRNLDSFVSAAETPIIKFIIIKAPTA